MNACDRTGCEFYVAQKLVALANVYGNSFIRERCGQKKAWDSVAECGTGRRVIAVFFGPCAPYALLSNVSAFSQYFKGLDRFAKLATGSIIRGCTPGISTLRCMV